MSSDIAEKCPLIGIATWGVIADRDSFQVSFSRSRKLKNTADRPVPPRDRIQATNLKLENGFILFTNFSPTFRPLYTVAGLQVHHSKFIFVDDGTVGEFGGEIQQRSQVFSSPRINQITCHIPAAGALLQPSGVRSNSDGTTRPADNVTLQKQIVLSGGIGTYKTIRNAAKNKVPVVIVRGTGGGTQRLGVNAGLFHEKMSGD